MKVWLLLGLCFLVTSARAAASSGAVKVDWNTQNILTLSVYTQTTASKTSSKPTSNDILWASDPTGSATSGCNGTIAKKNAGEDGNGGNGGWVSGTVNFGNVTPDSVDATDCYETNAVDLYVVSNDANGYEIEASLENAPSNYNVSPNGTQLCFYEVADLGSPGGLWTNNETWAASNRLNAAPQTLADDCAGANALIASYPSGSELFYTNALTSGSEFNSDLELVEGPNAAPNGSVTATLLFTLSGN